LINSGGVEWVSEHNQLEVIPGARQGGLKPLFLFFIDASQYSSIDGNHGEPISVHLKEGCALKSVSDSIILAQPVGFLSDFIEALIEIDDIGLRVLFEARPQRENRRVALQKVGVESFVSIKPVVITGNGVDGFVKTFERKIEVRLVVLHLPIRIDHV